VNTLLSRGGGANNSGRPNLPSLAYLIGLREQRFGMDKLVGVSPEEFVAQLEVFSAMDDAEMEGYQETDMQRQMSIRFHWSEDTEYGRFKAEGLQAKGRSSRLLARFMDQLGALDKDLTGKRVLDIGCWTGATSLLLAAMGAEVVAIEEVVKYAETVQYLSESFGVKVDARALSLYDLTADEFQDAFDIVLFSGVLYHLSDPIIGTRITFNAVKPGGICLLETSVSKAEGYMLEYYRPVGEHTGHNNWFFPTPMTVEAMMGDVGYSDIRSVVTPNPDTKPHARMLAVGTKTTQKDMSRAGLSVRSIR
jgi:2-polyprenyl-3-methyl-5-hydroxy-6-metoxy-1,4-benzoquinol methylase